MKLTTYYVLLTNSENLIGFRILVSKSLGLLSSEPFRRIRNPGPPLPDSGTPHLHDGLGACSWSFVHSRVPRSRSTETGTCINPGTQTGHSRLFITVLTVLVRVGGATANCSPDYSSLRHEPDKHARLALQAVQRSPAERPCPCAGAIQTLTFKIAYHVCCGSSLPRTSLPTLARLYSFREQTSVNWEHILNP
jgi:hypothetical protein